MKLSIAALIAATCLALSLSVAAAAPPSSDDAATVATKANPATHLIMHKTPWCGCCSAWAEQAKAAGFTVETREYENLDPIKQALGVPASQASCHTAEIDGYFVEGHVPFADLRRLLAERPAARGIAVPGMPIGSPGMEQGPAQPFSVNLVDRKGGVSEYARHNDGG